MEFRLINRTIGRYITESSLPQLQTIIISITPLALVLLTLAAYWPGLNGIFFLDDFRVLERIGDYGGATNSTAISHFVFDNKSGALGRPLSLLSFLINDQYWPSDPWLFKYTNLLIHILCGLSIWLLIYKITNILKLSYKSCILISALTATIWLLHPFNVSTTLYVVQRMTQLMTLFTLIGLLFFVHGRNRIETSTNKSIVLLSLSLIIFGALATLSKENGVLILFYILIIEFTLFDTFPRPRNYKIWILAAIILPIVLGICYFIYKLPGYNTGFSLRDFTQYERLLTEARIILSYLSYILVPRISGTGLLHDDYLVSTGIFSPVTTVLAIIFIISTIAFAIIYRKKYSVVSFSILWFYAGHLLESTFIPLELYFEHRNYLPMLGIIFAVSYYIPSFFEKINYSKFQKLIYFSVAALLILLFSQTYKLSIIWSNPDYMIPTWAKEHPDSLRAQKLFAQHLAIKNKPAKSLSVLSASSQKFNKDITLLLHSLTTACEYNLPTNDILDKIYPRIRTMKYTDGIEQSVSKLIKVVSQNRCNTVTMTDVHNILYEIEKVPDIVRRSKTISKLLFLHANIYVREGNLSQTIKLLDKANFYRPGVSIPLYQAWLLNSAGLYNDALRYLYVAEENDKKRKLTSPSRKNEIESLRIKIYQRRN